MLIYEMYLLLEYRVLLREIEKRFLKNIRFLLAVFIF